MAWVAVAVAVDELSVAENAVSAVLWEYEDSFEFVHYSINDSGFVDMTFASDTPDDLYVEIITKLNRHPDIDGVLAGKNGSACGLWPN